MSSKEEFLDPICQNVNKLNHITIDSLLDTIMFDYTKLMNDDIKDITPQEFDDFLQNDFIFESKLHFSSQDTSKLTENDIRHIFSFSEPLDFVKISKICKKWSQVSNSEGLWNSICTSCSIESNGSLKS